MPRAFVVNLTADRSAADLKVGGIYIANATVELADECHIVLRAGSHELEVTARAVMVDDDGAGFEILQLTDALRAQIEALVHLSTYADLDRKKTLTRALVETGTTRRNAVGSVAPATRLGPRVAQGSISPIAQLAPTRRATRPLDKLRAEEIAVATDDDGES